MERYPAVSRVTGTSNTGVAHSDDASVIAAVAPVPVPVPSASPAQMATVPAATTAVSDLPANFPRRLKTNSLRVDIPKSHHKAASSGDLQQTIAAMSPVTNTSTAVTTPHVAAAPAPIATILPSPSVVAVRPMAAHRPRTRRSWMDPSSPMNHRAPVCDVIRAGSTFGDLSFFLKGRTMASLRAIA